MSLNWTAVYNKMFKLIDGEKRPTNPNYFSGPRFIEKIQEFRPECAHYSELIAERSQKNTSTNRRDYFKDLFMELNDGEKFQFVASVLSEAQQFEPDACSELRLYMGGGTLSPAAEIPAEAWNADRLNEYLRDMDKALHSRKYEHTVTLAYTCLEGFFKAFVRKNIVKDKHEVEITALAREIKDYLKARNRQYPDEVLNMITQSAYALNRTRDRFSESHFGDEADLWLATERPRHF